MNILSELSVLLLCAISVNCMYFHLGETERRCFIEDLPEDVILVGKYKVEIFDQSQNDYVKAVAGFGMHVEVRDPEEQIMLSRTYAMEGRFTFTSQISGEHQVCIYSNSTAWFSSYELRVHLDLAEGESAVDLHAIQVSEKLSDLELRMRSLIEHTARIAKEQQYNRIREEHFRDLSASTNQLVLWWSLAQTCVFVIVGFLQIRHLRKFFEAKKLV